MSIIFILILISVLSSYIIIVNDQVAHSYDIVVQIEKNFKLFYETEFIIYYVLDFYQINYKELELPYSKSFDLYYLPSRKKIKADVLFKQLGKDATLLITIPKTDALQGVTLVKCHLIRELNGLIKIKNCQIEKRT